MKESSCNGGNWLAIYLLIGGFFLSGLLSLAIGVAAYLWGWGDSAAAAGLAWYSLAACLALLLPLSVLAAWLARELYCHPLRQIRLYLDNLSLSNLDKQSLSPHRRLVPPGGDEVTRLGSAIEVLRQQFSHITQELRKSDDLFELANEEVRINEERFELAVRATNEGIYDWNLENNSVYFSERWKSMLGYQVQEIGHQANEWFNLIHPDDLHEVMRQVKAHLDKETSYYHAVYRMRHKAGHYLWVRGRGLAVWDERGDPYRMVGTHSDITVQKEAEEALNKAKEMAESANLAKSQFIANMSHELRTPLNAIIGYSEMLKEDAIDLGEEECVPDLEKIHGAGRHLLALINDVLDISKIEAGKMEVFCEQFEVDSLLNDILGTVQPLVEQKGNLLELERPAHLGAMYSDLTKIRQMLFNLLSNAAKFTEKGTITLAVSREQQEDSDWLIFQVRDTGIGMTPEQKDKLFQAFTQADASTTRKYGGTGLGLAISKRFAEMLNGTVEVRSEFGVGTVFTLRLPAHAHKVKLPGASQAAASGATPLGTVLVVDDDPTAREILRSYLGKLGYQVAEAANGEECLRLARKLRPQAITLDVMMPGMDGWMVLSALKNDPLLAEIPVIIVSIIEDRGLAYSLGAAEYLTKPVDSARLGEVLDHYRQSDKHNLVMVVEDDLITRGLMENMLGRAGWRVCSAENGKVALDHLATCEELPRLILLDLMMPEMDGFQFIDRLRANEAWRMVPVVVLTAKDITLEDRMRLEQRVQNIFQKGAYRREELLASLREQLARETVG
jgi:PAS domain S-box-containing protein